jgi:ketosteroid isomerase-like protein
VLPASDIEMIGDALVGAAVGFILVAALCLAAIPQAVRYGKWLRQAGEFVTAGSTERGFPPPPVPAGSLWRSPAASAIEVRSRRRMYFALAGFAIGFGAGIGVLVSSTTRTKPAQPGQSDPPAVKPDPGAGSATASKQAIDAGAGSQIVDAGVAEPGSIFKPPATTVQAMLQDQRAAIARGDLEALVATVSPKAVGFGVDADEVVEGRDAIEAQVRRDLGELASAGVTVEVKFGQLGSENNHTWIAQELELSAPGRGTRRYAITQLAASIDGKWSVVAWHWAVLVRDDVAERVALLGTKPVAKAVSSKLDGPKELDTAVRAAFSSRRAFADARSERDDGFNFGSGPGERIVGGAAVKRIFNKLRAEIRLHDNAHVVAGSAWDPAQKTAPWIGFALVNADFSAKTRAQTELTQTFRVLAVVLKEGNDWKLVQTQWSHGGPVR